MNKITKTLSHEQGLKHYKLCTCDYSALQTRLATIDTCLNDQGTDPTLKAIYAPGGLGDLHAVTGFNTFVGPLHKEIIDAVDESGKTWSFLPEQKMTIKRNGQDIVIRGSEIIETDSIVDYA